MSSSSGVRGPRSRYGPPASTRRACPLGHRRRHPQAGSVAVVEPLSRPDDIGPLALSTGQAVVRTALLNRLCGAPEGTIATIVAPAGYGKTTLLAQWAQRDPRQLLWIDLEPEDDDVEVLESRLEAVAEEPELLAVVDDVHLLRSPAALEAIERVLG